MTREQASNILDDYDVNFDGHTAQEIAEAFDMAFRALEQEPCEDEYIKVPKKALKYRTVGMVAYNAEWLKNHFDIERDVICGVQEPCEDAISRQAVIKCLERGDTLSSIDHRLVDKIKRLQSVNPQPKTGHWIEVAKYSDGRHEIECSECGSHIFDRAYANSYILKEKYKYCPRCGAKMKSEVEE